MTRKLLLAAASGAAMFAAAPAMAQTVQVPLKVTTTLEVNEVCTVNAGGNADLTEVDFGTVQNPDDFVGNLDGSNLAANGGISLTVTCNRPVTNATFTISTGDNDQGGVRRLAGSSTGSFIPYRLYQDVARTVEFTPNTPRSIPDAAANTPFTIPIYGRILNADIRAAVNDSYNDAASGTIVF